MYCLAWFHRHVLAEYAIGCVSGMSGRLLVDKEFRAIDRPATSTGLPGVWFAPASANEPFFSKFRPTIGCGECLLAPHPTDSRHGVVPSRHLAVSLARWDSFGCRRATNAPSRHKSRRSRRRRPARQSRWPSNARRAYHLVDRYAMATVEGRASSIQINAMSHVVLPAQLGPVFSRNKTRR